MCVPFLWNQGFGIPRISAVILYCRGMNRLGIYVEQLEMAEFYLFSLKTMFFKPWIPGVFLYNPRNGQMRIFWKFVGNCFAVKSICLTIPLNGLCCTTSKQVCLQYSTKLIIDITQIHKISQTTWIRLIMALPWRLLQHGCHIDPWAPFY